VITERICVETRGFTGANLGDQWGGDGRRVVPCPSLDELDERDELPDDDCDSLEDSQ
jgi:hypothetical protein